MDVVTELAARATSYLVIIQEAALLGRWPLAQPVLPVPFSLSRQAWRAQGASWIGHDDLLLRWAQTLEPEAKLPVVLERAGELLDWVKAWSGAPLPSPRTLPNGAVATDSWRQWVQTVLTDDQRQRLRLANLFQLVPMQVRVAFFAECPSQYGTPAERLLQQPRVQALICDDTLLRRTLGQHHMVVGAVAAGLR